MIKTNTAKIQGLYAITDPTLCPNDSLLEKVSDAIHGGAKIIQYRDKTQPFSVQKTTALKLAKLCKQHKVLFIINDSIELAHHCKADGIHLGKNDSAIEKAREALGTNAIIGISCYNSLDRAQQMQDSGADYVAFGRFFASQTKPDAPQAEMSTLQKAKQQLNIPVVVIGGITEKNAAELIAAGADSIAVIQGIFAQNNTQHAAQSLSDLFQSDKSL